MKRYGLFLALLLFVRPANATISVTPRCVAGSTTSGNSIACAFSGSIIAGNLIAVQIARDTATDTITSVSDGVNTFIATPGSPCTKATGSPLRRTWLYYAKNATAVTNPTWTVIFSSTSTNYRKIVVSEIAGVSGIAPVDKETCANSGTSSLADPGTATLSFPNEAILEDSIVSGTNAVGTTFTSLGINSGNQAQFKVVTNGTWAASAFATAQLSWIASAVTFTDGVPTSTTPGLVTTASGEILTAQDFGTITVGFTKQINVTITALPGMTIAGLQYGLLPQQTGDFAILLPLGNNLPITLAANGSITILIEFRPKSIGLHNAELELVTASTFLTRVPLTGVAQ
jgi:hypothetical protein